MNREGAAQGFAMRAYRIRPGSGAMAARVVRDASAEELSAFPHRIVDLEAVGSLELTAEDLRRFAAADPFSSASRGVFVAAPGGDVGQGLARLHTASTEHGGKYVRVVFDQLEEACARLGVPEEPAPAVRGEDDRAATGQNAGFRPGKDRSMPLATIVCMLALLEYVALGLVVGAARGKYGVEAPATSGHPEFDRRYRVHYNTLEQLVVFVPALFAFAWFLSDAWAAALGLVFVVGRALYARSYIADPASRGPGMALTFLPNLVLVLGGLVGAGLALF